MNIDKIQQALFAEMQKSKDFDPCDLRLSESGLHPLVRLAYAQGAIARDPEGSESIFLIGNAVEKAVLKAISKAYHGANLHRDYLVRSPFCTGHADGVFIKDRKRVGLVEIKTAFSHSKSQNPTFHHAMQVQAYLHFLKIEKGVLIYIYKNWDANFQTIEDCTNIYPIDRDMVLGYEISHTLRRLHEAKQTGEIPDEFYSEAYKGYYCPPGTYFLTQRKIESWDHLFDGEYGEQLPYPKALMAEFFLLNGRTDKASKMRLDEIKLDLDPYFRIWGSIPYDGGTLDRRLQVKESLSLSGMKKCGKALPATLKRWLTHSEYYVYTPKKDKEENYVNETQD